MPLTVGAWQMVAIGKRSWVGEDRRNRETNWLAHKVTKSKGLSPAFSAKSTPPLASWEGGSAGPNGILQRHDFGTQKNYLAGLAPPPSHEAKGGVDLAENAGDSPLTKSLQATQLPCPRNCPARTDDTGQDEEFGLVSSSSQAGFNVAKISRWTLALPCAHGLFVADFTGRPNRIESPPATPDSVGVRLRSPATY
ncbi:hypothetical protein C8J57DRAFT_1236805 [Mycena rebaudengoi]|nr:hypothetical protein C8J57DRAFT_1236805 [Mycena rebaudengoi]